MKKEIHPKVMNCVVTCACGASFDTKSNQELHKVEVCNNCHPFYTSGTASRHKKTGAVEKFNKKFNLNQE